MAYQPQDAYNLLYKVILIGDSGVGKSNIMSRFAKDTFSRNHETTIGVDFLTKDLLHNDKEIKVQIWDTAGQERFKAISRSLYVGAKGAMLVYDITNRESFDHIPNWYRDIKEHSYDQTWPVMMLIGNKCDLKPLRAVAQEEAQRFAAEHGISVMETSALDKTNIDEAFAFLVKHMVDTSEQSGTVPQAAAPRTLRPQAAQPLSLSPTAAHQGGTRKPDQRGKKSCSC
eukprot:TRINITY_DN2222_c0_g1_i1.p1 TRINITY_DN2222_c0_g1~~TRINITY_DN2222_c0_g1_i1.p1  ORF type:complete len:254 (+),score=93.14 TRINITY_DN2222_c0_g1_i1:80-763(+)